MIKITLFFLLLIFNSVVLAQAPGSEMRECVIKAGKYADNPKKHMSELQKCAGVSNNEPTEKSVQKNTPSSAKLTFSNGSKYVGEVKNNKMYGRGVLTGADGTVMEGHWINNQMNGHGTLDTPNGVKYIGEWKGNKMHGKGVLTGADGTVMEGHWINNQMNGHGTLTSPEGVKYVGEWKDNKMHGEGVYTQPNGETITGVFRDNKLVKRHTEAKKSYDDAAKAAKKSHEKAAKKDSSAPSLFGTLVGIGLDIALDKDKGAPVDIRSAMVVLRQNFFESTNFFLQSQEQLLRAYGKDTEAQMVADAMIYANNSKISETDRMQNTIKVSTDASKIIELSLTSQGASLSQESKEYYASSLSPAARGITSTIKILPAVKTIVRAIKQDAQGTLLTVGFEMIGILTELPTYFSSMTGTMKFVLTGAKSHNIQGAEELELSLTDLDE